MLNNLTLKNKVILQVGLAVGDTEKMKKLATMKRLAMQIEYHIEIEESYPVFITRHFYEEIYQDKPNCKQPVHHRYVFMNVQRL